MCRWKGVTAEMDSLQSATILLEDCPSKVLEYLKKQVPYKDDDLKKLAKTHFPTSRTMILTDVTNTDYNEKKSKIRGKNTYRKLKLHVNGSTTNTLVGSTKVTSKNSRGGHGRGSGRRGGRGRERGRGSKSDRQSRESRP